MYMLGLSTILPPGDEPRTASGPIPLVTRLVMWALLLGAFLLAVTSASAQDVPPIGPAVGSMDHARVRAASLLEDEARSKEFAPYHDAVKKANEDQKFLVLFINLDGKYADVRRELGDMAICLDLKRQYYNESEKSGGPRIVFTDTEGQEFYVLEKNIRGDAARVIKDKIYAGGFPGAKPKRIEVRPGGARVSEEVRYVHPPVMYTTPTYYATPAYTVTPTYTATPTYYTAPTYYVPQESRPLLSAGVQIGGFSVGAGVGGSYCPPGSGT